MMIITGTGSREMDDDHDNVHEAVPLIKKTQTASGATAVEKWQDGVLIERSIEAPISPPSAGAASSLGGAAGTAGAAPPTWRENMASCWLDRGMYTVIILVGFVQGSANLSTLATQYFFKDDVHYSPAQLAIATGFIGSPWVIKPLYGFISDSYPILGRRRAPYFFIFGLTGFLCYSGMTYAQTGTEAVCALFGASLSISFCNVLAEALIVENGGGGKLSGDSMSVKSTITRLMTLFWGTESIVKIFSGYFSGQLLTVVSKRTIFGVASCFPLLLLLLSFVIRDEPRTAQQQAKLSPKFQAERVWGALKQREIWGPMLFVFLLMVAPSSQSSYFYFLTNELHMPPDFMGILSLVEGVSTLSALLFYHAYLNKFSYRTLLKVSIVLSVVAGATPLILILRLNTHWGISDRWFCIGDTAVLAAIGQISIMPLLVLGAETCPPNIEATLYSFLVSTLNIGSLLSTYFGAFFTWLLGVTSTDFHRLWLLCVICNFSTLCVIPFLSLVPPEKTAEEKARDLERRRAEAAEADPILAGSRPAGDSNGLLGDDVAAREAAAAAGNNAIDVQHRNKTL